MRQVLAEERELDRPTAAELALSFHQLALKQGVAARVMMQAHEIAIATMVVAYAQHTPGAATVGDFRAGVVEELRAEIERLEHPEVMTFYERICEAVRRDLENPRIRTFAGTEGPHLHAMAETFAAFIMEAANERGTPHAVLIGALEIALAMIVVQAVRGISVWERRGLGLATAHDYITGIVDELRVEIERLQSRTPPPGSVQ